MDRAAVKLLELAVGGFVLIFWLRMLFECAIEEPKGRERTLWLLFIIGHIFGALAYYLVRHRLPRLSTGRICRGS
jgi:hypothetical protein